MIGKQNQDHNYLRQAAGMVHKIQNQSQDHHNHQGNFVRSPIEIFGVSAYARVPAKVHRSRKNRATEAFYVGNFAFNTSEEDLSEALEHYLGSAIVVENVTIQSVNGRSKYGFIELSWAQATMLDRTS